MYADCQVQCGSVVLRTAAQANTMNPEWGQALTFGVKKPLGDAVVFKVFGLNERGRDVLLGGATLSIKALPPNTKVYASNARVYSRTDGINLLTGINYVDDAQVDATRFCREGTTPSKFRT